jgi:hypothetical protein
LGLLVFYHGANVGIVAPRVRSTTIKNQDERWKHDKYTQNVAIGNYSHIFTHKCKKIELKLLKSLLNNHGAKYWIYNLLYTKF